MVQTIAIFKSIPTLADVEERFNLTPTDNKQFLQNGIKIYLKLLMKKR